MEFLIGLLIVLVVVVVGVVAVRRLSSTFRPEIERARRIRRANRGE